MHSRGGWCWELYWVGLWPGPAALPCRTAARLPDSSGAALFLGALVLCAQK